MSLSDVIKRTSGNKSALISGLREIFEINLNHTTIEWDEPKSLKATNIESRGNVSNNFTARSCA